MRVLSVLLLAAFWIVLWGRLDAVTVVTGLVLGGVLVRLVRNQARPPRAVRWRWLPRLLGHVVVTIIRSNIAMAWAVLRGPDHEEESMVEVQLPPLSPRAVVVVALLTTLTPGTITVASHRSQDGQQMLVHALDATDAQVTGEVARLALLVDRMLPVAEGGEGVEPADPAESPVEASR